MTLPTSLLPQELVPFEQVLQNFLKKREKSYPEISALFFAALETNSVAIQQDSIRTDWIAFLKRLRVCLEREKLPYVYDFHSIIALAEKRSDHLSVKLEVVSPSSPHLLEIAREHEAIWLEGFGIILPPERSPEKYAKIFASEDVLYMIAQCEGKTVGCIGAIHVSLADGMKVLHFYIAWRNPSYPYSLFALMDRDASIISNRFSHLDYYTLCVEERNVAAKKKYESFGFFSSHETIQNHSLKLPCHFYTKTLAPGKRPLTYAEVSSAVNHKRNELAKCG